MEDEAALQELLLAKLAKAEIAARLGRTPPGIANKICELSRRSKGIVSPYAMRRTEDQQAKGRPRQRSASV
jgi:hypothetical protein